MGIIFGKKEDKDNTTTREGARNGLKFAISQGVKFLKMNSDKLCHRDLDDLTVLLENTQEWYKNSDLKKNTTSEYKSHAKELNELVDNLDIQIGK
ncbi:hypothetical protein MHBO_000654 [Bonamia ostreae]|uniref:Uncharacterized protein n=1 Tax=Bonamia ostreae TaxID=126728 RepID=A0ABV2AGC6_9EUKA